MRYLGKGAFAEVFEYVRAFQLVRDHVQCEQPFQLLCASQEHISSGKRVAVKRVSREKYKDVRNVKRRRNAGVHHPLLLHRE